MKNFKNLAFKGGGVLGIAYAGAIAAVEKNRILSQIEKVSGTSAGAIMAALVSLRYTADEIHKIVSDTDFKTFMDHWDPLRIPIKYGLYAGDELLNWITTQITQKGFLASTTFRDLKENNCLDLHVFATNLNTRSLQEFSFSDTADTIVAEAIRASMSIPLFFKAWTFSNEIPGKDVYVDGGLVYNFPITAFDGNEPNYETLGFYLSNIHKISLDGTFSYDEIGGYIKNLFEATMESQNVDFAKNPSEIARTVIIDSLGISSTDFHLTQDQKNNLFESGRSTTELFLAKP